MFLIKVFFCEWNIYLRVGIYIVFFDLVVVYVVGFEEVVVVLYYFY